MGKGKFRTKIWDDFGCIADIKESDVRKMEKKVHKIFKYKLR
jgi:hypothetical protein